MAIKIFNSDRASSMFGINISQNPGGSYPDACWDIAYAGAVLATLERNFHDDSDFYAIVWDAEMQQLQEVLYSSTRFWSYLDSATIDATTEVISAATDYCKAQARGAYIARAIKTRQAPHKGATVEVTLGRKIPRGTTGTVLSIEKKYNQWRRLDELWALIDCGNKAVSVKVEYLRVLIPSSDMPTAKEAAAAFDMKPYQPQWHIAIENRNY